MNTKSTRLFLSLFILTLLLASCTRSMVSTPTDIEAVVKLPTLIATAEAAMTADAQTAEQTTQIAIETAPLENEPVDETSTQPDTTSNLPTHTPTTPALPTSTSSPPTITAVPTRAITYDPQKLYGAPSKAFNHSTWNTFLATQKEDSYTLIVDDGPLTFTGHNTQWDTWFHITSTASDAYIEMNIELEECDDNDSYGILFRSAQNTTNGYIAQFSCDGQYSLWRLESASPYIKNYLVNWTTDPAINAGSYQANTIGVKAEANSIQVYANDILLTELPIYDNLFPNGTRVAAFIAPWETQNFTYMINSLNIWRIQ